MSSSQDRLSQLMRRGLPARDAAALKLARNLARNAGPAVAPLFVPFLDDLAAALQVPQHFCTDAGATHFLHVR